MSEPDEQLERVKLAAAKLGEHFDTVQIFVEWTADDGTRQMARLTHVKDDDDKE